MPDDVGNRLDDVDEIVGLVHRSAAEHDVTVDATVEIRPHAGGTLETALSFRPTQPRETRGIREPPTKPGPFIRQQEGMTCAYMGPHVMWPPRHRAQSNRSRSTLARSDR